MGKDLWVFRGDVGPFLEEVFPIGRVAGRLEMRMAENPW